ncbi:MFS transporter [Siccirubricoccus sp. KC 17139]|uniref:MFS transporter n=1 Tax=Siccirubricoccus soli TaxID=2899147 RepID=A0ABT1DBP7_9PROT|nr:MFS transporter [Siccirubricoccus soli]MCO6419366.1 MFS transporter [Siccirubricoccus soli]MCP2685501.1 MFS transporter [Siccirubricoccus soli]
MLRDRRFLLLLALGFSAGVPLPLVAGQVLRQWFTESGLSLSAIGLTALIGLAYANKFLWSPALDAVRPPLPLGQRRGWLLAIQAGLVAAILGVSATDPSEGAGLTVALAVLVAFLSASQDIVVDAWRIEMLGEDAERQAYGLAAYVWGYRLALLASGAGVLFLVQGLGWQGAYAAAALLMLPGMAAALAGPDTPRPVAAALGWRARLRASVLDPFAEFLGRRGWLAILLFVSLFKLGEALAGVMTTPFYRSLGFTREDVASVATVFGMGATLLGALAGGWLVGRLGTGRALVLTGLGQMLSNLMYLALVGGGRDMPMLFAQVGVESFTDGLADAAFLTYLSGLTSRAFTATQYALLSSLAAVPLRTLGAGSGWLAESLGWSGFFVLTTVAALPAMGIMLWLLRALPIGGAAPEPWAGGAASCTSAGEKASPRTPP